MEQSFIRVVNDETRTRVSSYVISNLNFEFYVPFEEIMSLLFIFWK